MELDLRIQMQEQPNLVKMILELSSHTDDIPPSYGSDGSEGDGHQVPDSGTPYVPAHASLQDQDRHEKARLILLGNNALDLLIQALDYEGFYAQHNGAPCGEQTSGLCPYGVLTGRSNVEDLLIGMGAKSVNELEQNLDNANAGIRTGAAYCLIRMGEAESVLSGFKSSPLCHPTSLNMLGLIATYTDDRFEPMWGHLSPAYRANVRERVYRVMGLIIEKDPKGSKEYFGAHLYTVVSNSPEPKKLLSMAGNLFTKDDRDAVGNLKILASWWNYLALRDRSHKRELQRLAKDTLAQIKAKQ